MFCCTLLYVRSSIAIILMWKRELVALLYLSSWCVVIVKRLFLAVQQGCLRFVIFPAHTHLLFLVRIRAKKKKTPFVVRVRTSIEENTLFNRALVRIRAQIEKKPFLVG